MSDMKSLLGNTIMLGILVFAIFSWIIILQSDSQMDAEDMITNNSQINDSYGDLAVSLNKQNDAENSLNALENVPPSEYVGDLNVGSTVSATRTARSIVVGLWNVYIKLPMVILGVSPIVSGAITTILLIFIAISIWAIWKGAIS